jgi:hypothetical protein
MAAAVKAMGTFAVFSIIAVMGSGAAFRLHIQIIIEKQSLKEDYHG